tara:strand:- start:459 stop:1946 length:1488 start_codon:yes stop_codon:yes gene_type:complete
MKKTKPWISRLLLTAFMAVGMLAPGAAFADVNASGGSDSPAATEEAKGDEAKTHAYNYEKIEQQGAENAFFTTSNLWLLLAAALVFIMHLGFATLEAGLSRSKNTVNVLFKNVFIICIGVLAYAIWGFNAMYPGSAFEDGKPLPAEEADWNGYFATGSWFGNPETEPAKIDEWNQSNLSDGYADYNWWTDFIFQAMFAATAATIVSGAVAERIKLSSFMVFAILLVMFAYPVSGAWKWGTGFLDNQGFYDFAGSSIVHAFGGFAALACVILLGARKGKYTSDGIKPIPGHSMPLATIGVFLLFLGWFGFNGGSVLSADPLLVGHVFVTTALAACAGGFAAIVASWIKFQKPDLSMALNGLLGGLVGITAGADTVGMGSAIVIGLIAGVIVVGSIVFFDSIKIDDPVGAISVHGVCGIWGTVAVGIFSFNPAHTIGMQLKGTLIISAWAFLFSLVVFGIIKAVMSVRVDEEEEVQGLDLAEHGQEAYPDFTVKSEN